MHYLQRHRHGSVLSVFLLLLATRCFIINVAIVVVGRLNKYTYLRTNLHPHIHMSMYVNRHVLSCIRMYIFLLSRSTLYQANGLFRFRCVCVSKNKKKPTNKHTNESELVEVRRNREKHRYEIAKRVRQMLCTLQGAQTLVIVNE